LVETREDIQRLRIVGGNLALDFVNTQIGPPGRPPEGEALQDYEDIVSWARYVGMLTNAEAGHLLRRAPRDPRAARDAYERAVRIRGYLYELFSSIALGRRLPSRLIAALRTDEAEAIGRAELVSGNAGFDWSWAHDDDLARPLWPVVHAATELLTAGPLDRVKGCAGCRFHFVDDSKNRSRRWCSMEDCGTVEKMRRYVARRAAARRDGTGRRSSRRAAPQRARAS
jgi:predicted RNA-binding Zn ribbon-like protein